jgi:hypothetical protein
MPPGRGCAAGRRAARELSTQRRRPRHQLRSLRFELLAQRASFTSRRESRMPPRRAKQTWGRDCNGADPTPVDRTDKGATVGLSRCFRVL